MGWCGSITRWNENTARGEDPDFGRGTSAIDKWWGDPQFGDGPAATLGPLDAAPYYAVRVYSGCLGTKGGPRINRKSQVLRSDGQPIPGLYGAGNCIGSPAGCSGPTGPPRGGSKPAASPAGSGLEPRGSLTARAPQKQEQKHTGFGSVLQRQLPLAFALALDIGVVGRVVEQVQDVEGLDPMGLDQ